MPEEDDHSGRGGFGEFLSRRRGSEEGESTEAADEAPEQTEPQSEQPETRPEQTEPQSERAETRSEKRPEMPPASATTAPSIGPHTVIETESAEDRLARHEQSDIDAMGLDKRRSVVGGSYSPSLARQATIYGIFLAVVAALVVGAMALANKLDQPPETNPDVAPWAQEDAAQVPPEPIDFPNYGNPNADAAPGPEL